MKLRRNQKISLKNLAISYLGISKFLGSYLGNGRKSDEFVFIMRQNSLVKWKRMCGKSCWAICRM